MSKLKNYISIIIMLALIAVVGVLLLTGVLDVDEIINAVQSNKPAALLIGITTFVLSAVGVYVGNAFGAKYKSKAELVGGVVLILIGLKILLEHLGMI